MVNKTENKFVSWCKSKGWYCKKFLVATANGYLQKQEADFLVANNRGVWTVECKERKGSSFHLDDLSQLRKTKLMIKKTNKIKPYFLFHFYEKGCVVLIDYDSYQNIVDNLNKKSFNLDDIPDRFKYTWRTLTVGWEY